MEGKFFLGQYLIWMILLLGQLHGYKSYIVKERKALLELKKYFISKTEQSHMGDVLPTWTNDTKSDCCPWDGVECNLTSRRVIGISVGRMYFKHHSLLNLSLMHPFEEVRSLNLSPGRHINPFSFDGFFDDVEGYESLRRLKYLQILDLSSNNFNNSILPFLNAVTSLTTLFLRSNFIKTLSIKELENLINLELLDLNFNLYNSSIGEFTHLKKLKALDLSSNLFSSSMVLQDLKNMTNLEVLGLARNNLDGPIPIEVFCEMKNLRELDLSGNHFVGQLPFCLASLEKIPSFLVYQENLHLVDLSNNRLSGHIPIWLLANNPELKALQLQNNLFKIFQLPTVVHNLQVLDFSANHIGGIFPDNIVCALPNMVDMNCSNNGFQGKLPSSMGEMKNISFLDLSYNSFFGTLPRSFFTGCFSLKYLWLSHNKFNGRFLPRGTSFTSLRILKIDNNLFTGEIGVSLISSTRLSFLDMSNNRLTGAIPSWLSKLSDLQILSLSNNFLEGTIPYSLVDLHSLSHLHLSRNQLSGALPSHMAVSYLLLHNNNFTGPIPDTLLEGVHILSLGNNKLSGSIPQFVNTHDIRILLLRGNNLTRSIPSQLCDLNNIRVLDLSNNKLNGFIPSCLFNLSFGVKEDELRSMVYEVDFYLERIKFEFYKSTFVVEELVLEGKTYEEIEINLAMKQRYESYTGGGRLFDKGVLDYIYGMDLSNNELSGAIPAELGDLPKVKVMNLSHNFLSSSIPFSFSNLKDIESLDLSYNMLHGSIPYQLTSLTSLEVFDVSHNNLSGIVPQGKQFNTFSESRYLGNPLLCGPPTNISCEAKKSLEEANNGEGGAEEDDDAIDMLVFYYSTASVYVIALICLVVLMCFDCPWRRAWLRIVDGFIASVKALMP